MFMVLITMFGDMIMKSTVTATPLMENQTMLMVLKITLTVIKMMLMVMETKSMDIPTM